ncbi:hypothetical protein [Flavobacterium rhizosphaerae]|uniref:Uncharacterized protein n=1 Tax=Flavobacterium rhizosphaerae TaxID=3163298 RepID=A0ABW8YX22_9FLAO
METSITPYQAIKRMREHSRAGIPFSIEFMSYNSTKNESNGFKAVARAQLRQGLRNDQSHMANTLVAYTDHSAGTTPRFFHLALLMNFNGIRIKP